VKAPSDIELKQRMAFKSEYHASKVAKKQLRDKVQPHEQVRMRILTFHEHP